MNKWLGKIRQSYRDLRLQTKFTITHLVITTLPMVLVFLFFYGRLYNMVVADTIRTEQTVSSRTTPLIEQSVDQVLETHKMLLNLPYYREVVLGSGAISERASETAAEAGVFREQVENLIDGTLITDIRIYLDCDESEPLFSAPGSADVFLPLSDALGTYWYGIFQGNRSYSALYCPSFYLSPYEVQNYGALAYITKSSVRYDGENHDCYTAVYYAKEPFANLLSENLVADGSVAYLINDRNSLVAASNETLAGNYHIDYDTVRNSFLSSNNFISKNMLGQDVYAGFYGIRKADWFMVVVMPSEPIYAKSIWIMVEFLLVYLGCVVVAFLIANWLSHSITNRISSVIDQMAKVRVHPPVALPAPHSRDEIGNLIDTYNYMTRVMNLLTEEQAKAAEDLRIAEFSSLQAQINPHFLYNTMDMINWHAQQGRTQEVSSAVQDLSRFYKLTLSRKDKIATIADEIEHVSIYVRLQNMRFSGGIDFVADIPDYLMDYQIPRLTFQPVVENCILHGILEKPSKEGAIALTGWLEENTVVILISDDGVGIPPERLSKILSGEGGGKGSNIAIYNTHRRLQLLYGLGYGLTYRSGPGKGTDVEIRLPAQTGDSARLGERPMGFAANSYLPLVMVSQKKNFPASFDTVSPLALLRHNKRLTRDLYEIGTIHQISDKFSKGEAIYILTHQITENFPAHTHDYFELSYVCRGSVINVVDSRELYMTAGDLIMMNRKAVQSLKFCEPDTLLLNFFMHQHLFDRTLYSFCKSQSPLAALLRDAPGEKSNYLFYPLSHNMKAQSLLFSMVQEYADAGFHQTAALEGMLLLLFDLLSHSQSYSYDGVDSQAVEALQYLRMNCLVQTPEELAEAFQKTVPQLEAYVKEHLGRALSDLVREVRLDHGLQLLAQPGLNIYQIAESCGYEDASRFFADFEAQFGISPAEYRRQFI